MATEQRERELVGSQAGLASAIAVESHGELGEIEAIRARGYWEQVWRRFRRDKVAIVSGGFIVFLIFVAIAGGPIAAHFLGHGPNDINLSAGLHGVNQLPVGPLSHVPCSGFAVPQVEILDLALTLFRIESECLELLVPFSRKIAETLDTDATG